MLSTLISPLSRVGCPGLAATVRLSVWPISWSSARCRMLVWTEPMRSCPPSRSQSNTSSSSARSYSELHSCAAEILSGRQVGSRLFLMTSVLNTGCQLPSPARREMRRNGSDLPTVSLLSRLTAENCRVMSSTVSVEACSTRTVPFPRTCAASLPARPLSSGNVSLEPCEATTSARSNASSPRKSCLERSSAWEAVRFVSES
mmetsp:Transcript_5515/g.13976  ORF Transcript_5515/g.13976 Transcript_5515/m.13976 type:complete len:202 (-) Transcript_5515:467-1072(-)